MGEQTFICFHELHIEAIAFDQTEFVTLFCRQTLGAEAIQFELDCHFSQLDALLRLGGECGDEVALELANRLARSPQDEEELLELSIVLKGESLKLKGYDFVVYEVKPVEKPMETFYLNPVKVYCLDLFYPAKRFHYGTVDYDIFIDTLKPYSLKLTQLYFNYLNARKNGYSEWEARKMFGLERSLFFNMAKELAEMWD